MIELDLHTGRHAALFGLGRLEEADDEYRAIESLRPGTVATADQAKAVVVTSKKYGQDGGNMQSITISPGGTPNQALSVAVSGTDVTVTPATESGRPASSPAILATLRLSSPAWLAAPK